MSFFSHTNKTCVHINGFALGLGLKRRLRATWKWAIEDYRYITDMEDLAGLEKNYNLNLTCGQASLKFHLPGQDFISCYFSLVHEQLVHILAHWASEWGKLLVQHKNLLVPDDRMGLFSSAT